MISWRDIKWRLGWSLAGSQEKISLNVLPLDDLTTETAFLRPLLSDEGRRSFLLESWDIQLPDASWQEELKRYQKLFQHYETACLNVPESLLTYTHQQFCSVIAQLMLGNRATCETNITQSLLTTSQGPGTARACTEFVGIAILMLDLANWRNNETLQDFLTRIIGMHSTQKDQYRIPLSFNGRTFSHKAGIKVSWESNLLSHLDIGLDGTCLKIFHHAAILDLYEHQQSRFKGIFPTGFFSETRRTMWLMLPQAERRCMKWFRAQSERHNLGIGPGDSEHLPASERNIQAFNFWRDRLIIAKDAFESSQPGGFAQFWRDDRNRTQWFTFWIALCVFILTLFGVLASLLQVYKAFYPSSGH